MKQPKREENADGRMPLIEYDHYKRLAAQERQAAIAAFPGQALAAIRYGLRVCLVPRRGGFRAEPVARG